MNLKEKIAVVTGASDGIGKQIALKLAKEGVSLALIARNENRLTQVKQECLSLGSQKVEIYVCDLKVKEQIIKTATKIQDDFGKVEILINNAGIWQKIDQFDKATIDDIENVISTNLTGLLMLTNLLLPVLRKQESLIINISSHSGIEAKQGQSLYCASKWGVTGFTESLRLDLKGSNVRVAGIYQGGTHTELFQKANDPRENELFNKFTKPEDLADVVVFMLSRPPQIWLHDVRIEY